jgi:hypothetical protein
VSPKDPRYTLPAMVFIAALASAWIPSVSGKVRFAAIAVVGTAAVITFVGTSFGIGGELAVRLSGSPPTLLGEHSVRLYRPGGYTAAAPHHDSDAKRLMTALKADGIDTMELDPGRDATWKTNGLEVLMGERGLYRPPAYDPAHLASNTVFLTWHQIGPGVPAPCGRVSRNWGLYLLKGGNAVVPFEQYRTWCPPAFPRAG